MAVTSIWPIKGRIAPVIEYARNPGKTIETSREQTAALHQIDGVLEYAADDVRHLFALHSGVFIAAPEYNSSITPLLKNTLDWMSRVREGDTNPLEVFRTRVFAIGSASPGALGGLRGLNTVRQVLELGLGALVLPEQFAVSRAADAFDEHGHLKAKDQQETFKALIQKLARAAHVLHG